MMNFTNATLAAPYINDLDTIIGDHYVDYSTNSTIVTDSTSPYGKSVRINDGYIAYKHPLRSMCNYDKFTIELRVKLISHNSFGVTGILMMGDVDSNDNRIQIQIYPDGSISVYSQLGGGTGINTSSIAGVFKLNTWHHVSMVMSSITGGLLVFLDGIKVITGSSNVIQSFRFIYVGTLRSGGMARSINGYVDEFLIIDGRSDFRVGDFTPSEIFGVISGDITSDNSDIKQVNSMCQNSKLSFATSGVTSYSVITLNEPQLVTCVDIEQGVLSHVLVSPV
jgi:hypothetical protein